MLGVELDGTQVDVEIEPEAKAQDHGSLDQAGLDIRMAYRPQQYGIQRAPFVDDAVGYQFLGFEIVRSAVGILDQPIAEALHGGGGLQDLQSLAQDFRTYPVAREHPDVVRRHIPSVAQANAQSCAAGDRRARA